VLFAATYGRGIWTFKFSPTDLPGAPAKPPVPTGVPLAAPFTFELDAQGWTAQSTGLVAGVPVLEWRQQVLGANNSLGSFGVSPYGDQTDASAVSPKLTHPGGWVFVDFQSRRDLESQCACDAMSVEWSSDGTNWSPVPWTWDPGTSTWSDELVYQGARAKNPDFPNFTLEKVAFQAPAGSLSCASGSTAMTTCRARRTPAPGSTTSPSTARTDSGERFRSRSDRAERKRVNGGADGSLVYPPIRLNMTDYSVNYLG
jgi:hypothetical protein